MTAIKVLQEKERRKPNCYIWGWHGQMNTGDDAFAIVANWGLRHYLQANRVFMGCDISGTLARRYGISVANGGRWSSRLTTRAKYLLFRQRSSYFVLAGGNLLQSPRQVDALISDNHWFQRGRKAIALGISVGPFASTEHEAMTERYLNRFSFVSFRDCESNAWALSKRLTIPFVNSFDLAVLLPRTTTDTSSNRPSRPTLGVSLLNYDLLLAGQGRESNERFARKLGKATAEVARNTRCRIRAFSLCRHPQYNDDRISEVFANACGDDVEVYRHDGDALSAMSEIRKCTHFVSMRLHGSVLAYTAEIPFLMLGYHSKCSQFANSVGLDPEFDIALNEFSSRRYREALERLLSDTHTRTTIPLSRSQERAMGSFTGAAKILGLSSLPN